MRQTWICPTALIVALASGCGPSGGRAGDLAFFLEAEESITDGLVPGADVENIVDGWTVTFDRYVVALGDVHARSRASGADARDPMSLVVDLVSAPATGVPLVTYSDLPVGTYDDVGFALVVPTAASTRHPSVDEATFAEVARDGCTYLLEGTITNPAGESRPPGSAMPTPAPSIAFRVCVPAATAFGPCSTPDGMEGVVVTDGGTTNASFTLHGDHPFFDAFPSGDELISRRAQWLADSDLDLDHVVTEAELMSADAAAIFPSALYNLSGAPVAVGSPWDFLVAQLRTQGHLNGEGECPWGDR